MVSLLTPSTAITLAQRAKKVKSSLYHDSPEPRSSVVIKITAVDGKTLTIQTNTPASTAAVSLVDSLSYHLHTIGLLTYSDAKTVLVPFILFGIGHALSASVFGLVNTPSALGIFIRFPQIAAWVYLNLIAFCAGNQRHPSSILEDTVNKPWRPLPSKRINPDQAFYLMLAAHILAFLFSVSYGGSSQTIHLAVLGYMYNELGGSDKSCLSRHFINGLGFISFGAGSMEIALGRSVPYSPFLFQWLRVLAFVVATGVHTADMYDQQGDYLAKRRTLPLVIGDKAARWVLAISVVAWSYYCPYFWSLGSFGYILPVVSGAIVAKRAVKKRTIKADKITYKLWNLWLVSIYCLPLLKVISRA